MNATIKHMLAGTFILLILPVSVWLSGWRWRPGQDDVGLKALFWLTQTVTYPVGIITSLLLCGWFLYCLRLAFKPALLLVMLISIAILAGQWSQAFIKQQVREPRPYILWLWHDKGVNPALFYALSSQARSEMLALLLAKEPRLPKWQKRHWTGETGFAFPSGHSVFAAGWALLGMALLWPRRHRITVIVLLCWATGVICSRLLLGMHWPVDVVVATLLAGVIVFPVVRLAQRYCQLPAVASSPALLPPQRSNKQN